MDSNAENTPLRVAISPCPNDTFAFFDLIHAKKNFEFSYLDIEALNQGLLANRFDISKGSFTLINKIADRYQMLSSGAAIGDGVGPVLVSMPHTASGSIMRVALPGENTTAHRLFNFYAREKNLRIEKIQMPFSEIIAALKTGRADWGVLIHEGRFIYVAQGLALVSDLGEFYREKTRAMIPLGCIYAARHLSQNQIADFQAQLKAGIAKARFEYAHESDYFLKTMLPFIKEKAQEKDNQVIAAHIETYVTEDTYELSEKAQTSIAKFKTLLI